MIRIAIVILNWNGVNFLKRFLPSVVEHSSSENICIWVADNGSTDGSQDFLKDHFPDVLLQEFDINYGFAGGYNNALSTIEAEYYILLNSDAEVTMGWTEPLLDHMEKNPLTAACMPKVRDMNRREYFEHAGAAGGFIDILGYPFCRGRIFDTIEVDKGQYDEEREIFWATGACMMIRASDWHDSGGFDQTFFAHMEEIDLCWRLKNKGRKIMVCPSSVIYHYGGGSLPQLHPKKTFLNFRNSLIMLYKNLPAGKLHRLPLRLLMDLLSVIKFLTSLSFQNAFAVIRAHLSFLALVPYCIRSRRILHKELVEFKKSNPGIHITESNDWIYRRSIAIDYFLLNKKFFSQLGNWNNRKN